MGSHDFGNAGNLTIRLTRDHLELLEEALKKYYELIVKTRPPLSLLVLKENEAVLDRLESCHLEERNIIELLQEISQRVQVENEIAADHARGLK